MKKLSIKNAVLAVMLTTGLVASAGASAQEVSLERAISQTIMAQGQKLVSDLGTEIQKSISKEINEFSIKAATTVYVNEVAEKDALVQNNVNVSQNIKSDEE